MYLVTIASHSFAALLLLLRCSLTEQHHLGLSPEILQSYRASQLETTGKGSTHLWETKNFLEDPSFRILRRIKRFTEGDNADSAGAAIINPVGRDPLRPPAKVVRPEKIVIPRIKEINWNAVKQLRKNKQKPSPSSPSTRGQTNSEGATSTTNCGRFQQWCPPTSPQHRPIPPVVRFPLNPGQDSSTSHIHIERRPSVPSILSSQVNPQDTVVMFPSSPFRQSNHPQRTSSFPSTLSQNFSPFPQWSSAPHFHVHHRPSRVGRSGS